MLDPIDFVRARLDEEAAKPGANTKLIDAVRRAAEEAESLWASSIDACGYGLDILCTIADAWPEHPAYRTRHDWFSPTGAK